MMMCTYVKCGLIVIFLSGYWIGFTLRILSYLGKLLLKKQIERHPLNMKSEYTLKKLDFF